MARDGLWLYADRSSGRAVHHSGSANNGDATGYFHFGAYTMIRLNESTRALLAVGSTFVMGFIVGCGADRTLLSAPSYAASSSTRQDVARHHDEVLAELRTELGLSDKQYARVQEIFKARQGQIEAAWQQVHADMERAMQQTTAEIETVLDSTQVQKLHAWIAARHGSTHGVHVRTDHTEP
jgi:hypothetical protein